MNSQDLRSQRFRQVASCILPCLAVILLSSPVFAGGIENFQHGGRATGQAGAFTARADSPSAIFYNPAGIAGLTGLQAEAGLDFRNATDDYSSETGRHSANHTIQFPPALYATWAMPEGRAPLVFGLGIDTPAWYSVDWDTALFPGRFLRRELKLRLFQVHPVVAYQVNDNWSVGGGLRYIFGDFDSGLNFQGTVRRPSDNMLFSFEGEALSEASVSAVTFDVGVQYATNVWGWGAVLRGGADLDETGDFSLRVRDLADPSLIPIVTDRFAGASSRQSFELPVELVGGAWLAIYPELRVELDLAWAQWSTIDDLSFQINDPNGPGSRVVTAADWDDTLSLRIGVEGDLTEQWAVFGGLGFESSPVSASRVEPGFPRGDAIVYAVGGSYNLPQLSFDVGYSFFNYDTLNASGQEFENPGVEGEYSGKEQVWSISARWRF